ncbi:MAG: aldehyde dehydrogenase family protein, partial [Anaerolineae bacterium]|nr:aldehyde dehydrogenase family protein [Anaerolineae bacterium]
MADKLTDSQIEAIVQRVKAQLGRDAATIPPAGTQGPAPHLSHVGRAGRATPEPARTGRDGIYPDLDSAVAAARRAFRALDALTLEKRFEIVAAMRAAMRANAELLARMACEETGLGRVEDKIQKNLLVIEKTPGPEILQPLAWTGDRGLTLVERAPYGVFGVITPSTNPTSTIINNAIGLIAAGNAAVFNVHPGAKRVSAYQLQLLNRAIVSAGGPPDLLTAPAEPTIESAQALMRHPGIRILLITGGEAVVKLAMASGKRAICAGPGNPPVVVDE